MMALPVSGMLKPGLLGDALLGDALLGDELRRGVRNP